MDDAIFLRDMTDDDLEAVLKIERLSFPTPWSRALFEKELATPFARSWVAEAQGGIAGYLCLWLVAGEAHILNLAVDPRQRNRGIGGRLLEHALEECRREGVKVVTLEARRSNYRAISLYRDFHFQPQGIRRRYYTDTGEDAVVMGLRLRSDSAHEPQRNKSQSSAPPED